MKRKTPIAVLISDIVTVIVFYVIFSSFLSVIENVSNVKVEYEKISEIEFEPVLGLDVYSDESLSVVCDSISWKTVSINGNDVTVNSTVFIKNKSNVDVWLSVRTSNWNPVNASKFITLDWDYDKSTMSIDNSMKVTLFLTVFKNCTGITNYSFDIVITCHY